MSISLCNTEQKVKRFLMRLYKNESALLTVKILWLSLRCFAPKPSSKSRDFVMASSCCDLTMPHLLWYTKADFGSLGSFGFTPFMKARKDLSRSFGFKEADTHGGRESLTAPERTGKHVHAAWAIYSDALFIWTLLFPVYIFGLTCFPDYWIAH